MRAAFPDIHLEVEDTVAEGDLVAFRGTFTGTHLGDGMGIAPTGRFLEVRGMSMGRWREGCLVEGWNHHDLLSLYRGLGLLRLFDGADPGSGPQVRRERPRGPGRAPGAAASRSPPPIRSGAVQEVSRCMASLPRTIPSCLLLVAAACVVVPDAGAALFRVGEVNGLFNVSLAYGFTVRTEERDEDQIGIGNGGNLPSVNGDDGNLNYDVGIVANQIRGTGELTLVWRNFGAYVRGYGFYDFENELGDRQHRKLKSDALSEIGSGGDLQDAYLSANFNLGGIPIIVRAGRQVVNWGDTGFLRFGVDNINPIDLTSLVEPTTTARDLFLRQGMVFAAANLTETIAVEGLYQFEWRPVVLPPTGGFASPIDLIGSDGLNAAFGASGRYSDLGTDLDEAFGTTTLGFDRDFMKYLPGGRDEPRSQGQFGLAVRTFVPALNSTKLALHFLHYHSRLPLISGFTAPQAAVDATSFGAVTARALDLAAAEGISLAEALPIEEELTISGLTNETRFLATYPEDINMLGFSFSTATTRTGTLIAGEVSHHFDWPTQQPIEEVLTASLSPLRFPAPGDNPYRMTSLGTFGADEVVSGVIDSAKTQVSLSLAQLFGPALGAAQSLLSFDVGYVHIHDLPRSHPDDADSWGYRILASLQFEGLFGGLGVSPTVLFTHDVEGITPEPLGPFSEDLKSITVDLSLNYTNTWTSSISYTNFFGGPDDPIQDRDFFRFNVIFHY